MQKEMIVSQRIIDKLVDKFLIAVEHGHSEMNIKIDDGNVLFSVTNKEKDEIC